MCNLSLIVYKASLEIRQSQRDSKARRVVIRRTCMCSTCVYARIGIHAHSRAAVGSSSIQFKMSMLNNVVVFFNVNVYYYYYNYIFINFNIRT